MALRALAPVLAAASQPAVPLNDGKTLAFASAASVVLLALDNEHNLVYQTALAFPALHRSSSFPSRSSTEREGLITSLCTDPSRIRPTRIAGSTDRRVSVWQRSVQERDWGVAESEVGKERWDVHSELTLPAEEGADDIRGLALANDRLAVQTSRALYYYTSDLSAPAPLWTLLWSIPLTTPTPTRPPPQSSEPDPTLFKPNVHPTFSPNGLYLAYCQPTRQPVRRLGLSTAARPTSSIQILSLHKDGCIKRPSRSKAPGQTLSFGSKDIVGLSWWVGKDDKSPPVLLSTARSVRIKCSTTLFLHTPIIDDPTFFALVHTLSSEKSATFLQVKRLSTGKEDGDEGTEFVGVSRGGRRSYVVKRLEESSLRLVTSSSTSATPSQQPASDPMAKVTTPSQYVLLGSDTLVRTPPGGIPFASKLQPRSHSSSSSSSPLPPAPPSSSISSSRSSAGLQQGSIRALHRTPNGRSVLVEGTEQMVVLSLSHGTCAQGGPEWETRARWERRQGETLWAVFARGRSVVAWDAERGTVDIRYLRPISSKETLEPSARTTLPGLPPDARLTTLIGLSDVDDGTSKASVDPALSIVLAATREGVIYTWSLTASDGPRGSVTHEPVVRLLSTFRLPADDNQGGGGGGAGGGIGSIVQVLPVDPMAWRSSVVDWSTSPPKPQQDLLLVVRSTGELEYWAPEGGFVDSGEWVRNGFVRTGKVIGGVAGEEGRVRKEEGDVRVRCSSAKKTVLVCWKDDVEEGTTTRRQELTIWDSKSSEFYSGLEYSASYPADNPVLDLDWTSTPDKTSVLAVGFRDHVLLLCEQRLSYLTGESGGGSASRSASYWAPLFTVPVASLSPHSIRDSIWLSEGTLAIGVDSTLFLHSRQIDYGPRTDGQQLARARGRDLFESVALSNAPLEDWHPQLLLQCMLWNKVDLVKKIVTQLYLSIESALNQGLDELQWTTFEAEAFFGTASGLETMRTNANGSGGKGRYQGLFGDVEDEADENGNEFGRRLVDRLLEHLTGSFPLPITRHERDHLCILVKTVLEVDDLQRSLDINGLRYLISLRFHINWRTRSTPTSSAAPSLSVANESGSAGHRHERLSFRNVVWAYHSQSQEILLSATTEACRDGKMRWKDAKMLGVFMWLKSQESLRSQMEVVARNEYMQGDDRDPTTCSIFYFALGKVKLVQGLWKQAAWHPEQKVMLKFLGNDFSLERWQTAALKNAFALMSKRRFEYAAAFFLLGGSLKDAANVCIRQLEDYQLAIALTRIVEGDDGPVLKHILRSTVLPFVFAGGHRWLGTWSFWMLKRRDLAVRILITPLADLRHDLDFGITSIADPHDDDPSLALLFSQIKTLSLQTAKGSSEVPEKTEFNFVLHNARVFTRMGCPVLGLDLVRSWAFDRPERVSRAPSPSLTPTARTATAAPFEPSMDDLFSLDGGSSSAFSTLSRSTRPPAQHQRRPSSFLRDGRRGSTMVIDMDLPSSELPTRAPSPELKPLSEEVESPATLTPAPPESPAVKKTGLGSLMKAAKQDAKQGAMEFDMSAFGF